MIKTLFGYFLIFGFFIFSFNPVFAQEPCDLWQEKTEEGCITYWFISQDLWLAVGVGVAAIGVFIAAWVTVVDRQRDFKKRTEELIQSFNEQLRNITEQERNLKTKLDCSLYVEQYLDVLEIIATLHNSANFDKKVAEFFENNFSYGIHLWKWYHDKVVKIKEGNIEELWHSIRIQDNNSENIKKFCSNERWSDFRDYCNHKESNGKTRITPFDIEFGDLGEEISDNDGKYGILPDLMLHDYEQIPDEDGLSKAELVEIINRYGNDLAALADDEKSLETKLSCSLYAEKYLDILEQIASLYSKTVIPKKGADYFENKFAYGIHIWKWYHEKVVKIKEGNIEELWYSKRNEKNNSEDIKNFCINERWRDFRDYCHSEENGKSPISEFEINFGDLSQQVPKEDKYAILPDSMINYDDLTK